MLRQAPGLASTAVASRRQLAAEQPFAIAVKVGELYGPTGSADY